MTPKISISVLNRNGIERLKKIIHSLVNQKYENFEILVFDNGSSDESVVFLENFKNIRIIKSDKNLGYGKAKNILVKESAGDYVLLLDNDIELCDSNVIQDLLNSYTNLSKVAFLSPIVLDIDSSKTVLGLYYNKKRKNYDFEKIRNNGAILIPAYRGNTVFFQKNIFLKLGMYDEIYPFNIDDYDLSARAYLAGYLVYVDTNLRVIHHGVESRINLSSLTWKYKYYLAGFMRVIIKNYSCKNLLIWLPVSFIWITYKVLYTAAINFSLKPIFSHVESFVFLINDYKSTIRERKNIQKNRKVQDDVFLSIKEPKL